MRKIGALLALPTKPNLATSRLIVTEPTYGTYFQPLITAWGIHLDVVAAIVALTQITGADFQNAIRHSQCCDGAGNTLDEVIQHCTSRFGCGHGKNLDFVELVATQHAAGITACRTCFATKARRERHVSQRQYRLVKDLPRMQ